MTAPDTPDTHVELARTTRALYRAVGLLDQARSGDGGIAGFLAARGYTGYLCSPTADPVANFISDECGGVTVYVGLTEIAAPVGDLFRASVPMTDWLNAFIREFDMQLYPTITVEVDHGKLG